MSNKKMKNLFVKGKKAALIALLASLPLKKASAYDERAYMTPGEHAQYEAYGILPDDIEAKMNDKTGDILMFLFLGGALVGVLMAGKKHEKQQQQLKQQQNQR